MLRVRYWSQRIWTDIKSTSFHTKVEKVETNKKITLLSSLVYVTQILNLFFKVSTFIVGDFDYMLLFAFI